MLSTVNGEAAARIGHETDPLPEVGTMVVYHPRPGEVRRDRTKVPAIVMLVDAENRHLDLMAIHEADDFVNVGRVPEYREGERGWSRVPTTVAHVDVNRSHVEQITIDGLHAEVEVLKALILGDYEVPDDSVLSMIESIETRIDALKKAAGAKRGPKPKAIAASAVNDSARAMADALEKPRRGRLGRRTATD